MDIKKGYFINHVDNAPFFIEQLTSEKVAPIPYPMESSDKKYYITISGKVFFAKTISRKGFVIQKKHVNRPLSENLVKLSTGKHREIQVTVAQCLYNSFVIGKWLDVRPCYKNGNKRDCSLDNLVLPFEASPLISSIKIGMYTELYKSHFDLIRLYTPGIANRQGQHGRNRIEIPGWQDFPTQSPVCNGNDGFPGELPGITFSKWRQESIKALGNSMVAPLVYEIFLAIEQVEETLTKKTI